MSSRSLSIQDAGAVSVSLRTGVALAVTVAMLYVLCTPVWLAVVVTAVWAFPAGTFFVRLRQRLGA